MGKAREPDRGRWFVKLQSLTQFHRADGVWTHVMRVINRRDDEYHERITDLETGEVRREVHEPLSQHQGRGSAKPDRRRDAGSETR